MAGPLFWANSSSGFVISLAGGSNWTGRGGDGGNGNPPVSEEITISPAHGSGEYEITEIGGVLVSKFNFIQYSLIGITQTGAPAAEMTVQTSTDGGSTWRDGATDYKSGLYINSSAVESDAPYLWTATSTSLSDSMGVLSNVNGAGPIASQSVNMFDSGGDDATYFLAAVSKTAEAINAIRFHLVPSSGSPVFTGGTIDLTGYR